MKKYLKINYPILLILITNLVFIIFLKYVLQPIHYTPQPLFLSNLIDYKITITYNFLIFFGLGNVVLLWLLVKRLFNNRLSLLSALVFSISPWQVYLITAESYYVYLLFLTLSIILITLLINSRKSKLLLLCFLLSTLVITYSSLILSITLLIIFTGAVLLKIIHIENLKMVLIASIIIILPIFFLSISKQEDIKQVFINEIGLFSDPGTINAVNDFQGNSIKDGYYIPAKLTENKYLYLSKYVLLKISKSLTPTNFFTYNERLLGFSFNPPIYSGFLIPFLIGLFFSLQKIKLKMVLILIPLILPAVVSNQLVDLNRLLLIAPLIVLITSYGLKLLIENKSHKPILFFVLLLVVFQVLVTLTDVSLKENERLIRYHNGRVELGKQ